MHQDRAPTHNLLHHDPAEILIQTVHPAAVRAIKVVIETTTNNHQTAVQKALAAARGVKNHHQARILATRPATSLLQIQKASNHKVATL